MAELDLKSETIDKVVDKLAEPIYNDAVKPAIETSKGVLGFCSEFIVSGIKPFMYSKIKECEYKVKEIDKKLEEKYNQILPQNRTEPRTNILGPAVDVLKYNLNEEYIKNMFIELIGKDMDKTKQSKVLPVYVTIVNQLNKEDAEFLILLKNKNLIKKLPVLRLKLVDNTTSNFSFISDYFICLEDNYIEINPLVLDNLLRLQIIKIPFDTYIPTANYENIFNLLKNEIKYQLFAAAKNKHLKFTKEELEFTNLGKNFIDICLS